MADNKFNPATPVRRSDKEFTSLIPQKPRKGDDRTDSRRYVRRELAREMQLYSRRSGRLLKSKDQEIS